MISKTITKPIHILEYTRHNVEKRDFNIESDMLLNDEIWHLNKTFRAVISKIKLQIAAAVSNEKPKLRKPFIPKKTKSCCSHSPMETESNSI